MDPVTPTEVPLETADPGFWGGLAGWWVPAWAAAIVMLVAMLFAALWGIGIGVRHAERLLGRPAGGDKK